MRRVHDLKASVLWCKSANRVPDAKSEAVVCRCALWMLIFLSSFCSGFNPSLATGIGFAVSLYGEGDEVRVEHAPSLVMTDALAIEAWILPLGPGSSEDGGIIVSKLGEYQIARFGDGSIRFAAANENPGWEWIDSGYVVPEGTWAHLALTYSASAELFQLFADGVLVFSTAGTGNLGDHHPTLNHLKIGARREGVRQFFNGLIDEVRVWNIVRTGTEIRATMDTPLQGNEPGLAGYWNFDDGTASDLSKNWNHGTLRGDAEIVTTLTAKLFISAVDWLNAGDTFTLDLMVEDLAHFAGWQLDIAFNPEVLRVVSVTEGDFLSKDGDSTFFQEGEIDNTEGQITGISGVLISRSGVSGTGVLLSITFEAKAAGEGGLKTYNVKLGADNRARIPYEIVIDSIIIEKSYDVNGDGEVNILDLTLVAQNFGQANAQADVNGNGIIDIFDLIVVAQDLATTPLAPGVDTPQSKTLNSQTIQTWIDMAHAADDGSEAFQRGIVNLKHLLSNVGNADLRSLPAKTALFANYPNPFNPETWIPYRLAEDAFVTLTIYDSNGQVVRTLDLGHQTAAVYESRSKAVYWDGRNNLGESVASGLYFYTLTAGDFSATRKMLILK